MDVLCINDIYDGDTLAFYKDHGVSYPKKDKIYTIRDVKRTFNGTGLLLEEIQNPQVPIHGVTGIIYIEPSFNIKRFVTLNKESLSMRNLSKIQNDEKVYTDVNPDDVNI